MTWNEIQTHLETHTIVYRKAWLNKEDGREFVIIKQIPIMIPNTQFEILKSMSQSGKDFIKPFQYLTYQNQYISLTPNVKSNVVTATYWLPTMSDKTADDWEVFSSWNTKDWSFNNCEEFNGFITIENVILPDESTIEKLRKSLVEILKNHPDAEEIKKEIITHLNTDSKPFNNERV